LLDAHTALTTDAFPQSLSCRVVNDCVKWVKHTHTHTHTHTPAIEEGSTIPHTQQSQSPEKKTQHNTGERRKRIKTKSGEKRASMSISRLRFYWLFLSHERPTNKSRATQTCETSAQGNCSAPVHDFSQLDCYEWYYYMYKGTKGWVSIK
jgi:hypothetical protein